MSESAEGVEIRLGGIRDSLNTVRSCLPPTGPSCQSGTDTYRVPVVSVALSGRWASRAFHERGDPDMDRGTRKGASAYLHGHLE